MYHFLHLALSTEACVLHPKSSENIAFPAQFTGNSEKLIGSFKGVVLFCSAPTPLKHTVALRWGGGGAGNHSQLSCRTLNEWVGRFLLKHTGQIHMQHSQKLRSNNTGSLGDVAFVVQNILRQYRILYPNPIGCFQVITRKHSCLSSTEFTMLQCQADPQECSLKIPKLYNHLAGQIWC